MPVPSVGPKDAKVMFVGEAPGGEEVKEGEPFVGRSGQFLMRYLNRVGYQRHEVFLTNLCKHQPKGNQFKRLLGTSELEQGLKELSAEIEEVNPNVIVTLGAWPMYYLTGMMSTAQNAKPGSGITQWRGSVLPGTGAHVPSAEGRKVLMTYHPAYIIRPTGFQNHPVFLVDLKKIKREAKTPEINYPEYDSYINPPHLTDIAHEMSQSEWLTVDIETFGQTLACVGFADSVERGLCITHECPGGWEVAQQLLKNDQKKIFQFGAFDINYLWWFYGWETNNYAFDTYIAAANLLQEFPRGLDFLTSIYTPYPFYKEERKTWKETGDMRTLWEYNIKDVIATHWIAMEQMEELRRLT